MLSTCCKPLLHVSHSMHSSVLQSDGILEPFQSQFGSRQSRSQTTVRLECDWTGAESDLQERQSRTRASLIAEKYKCEYDRGLDSR